MVSLTRTLQRCSAVAAAVVLTGCVRTIQVPGPQQDTNALLGIKSEWLRYCEELPPEEGDMVGDLQDDYTSLARVAASCAAIHHGLVGYLLPRVKRAQEAAKRAAP